MRLASLRPAYLLPRLRQMAFVRRRPDAPWLTESATLLLESWLRTTDSGLEWGSGRSTVWLAKRVGKLISVEADRQWHDRVKARLVGELAERVDYRHVPCALAEIDEPAAHPYAEVGRRLADESIDFALVDGHIRVTCTEAVLSKIKPGGLLVLDNANRYIPNLMEFGHTTAHEPRLEPRTERWRRVLGQLKDWRAVVTTDGIWDTRFWVKPPRG